MIKLAPLLKEIEIMRPFSGRVTNVDELESYLNFLERKEGKGIYNTDDKEFTIEQYKDNNITIIPKNVKSLYNLRYVEGDLSLIDCENITSFPNNLTVTGDLFINHTHISEIPNNLNIGGNLYCGYTPLAKQYSSDKIKQMIIDKGGSVQEVYS